MIFCSEIVIFVSKKVYLLIVVGGFCLFDFGELLFFILLGFWNETLGFVSIIMLNFSNWIDQTIFFINLRH
jgi:hypothetical protein